MNVDQFENSRVLAVDDDEVIRLMYRKVLSSEEPEEESDAVLMQALLQVTHGDKEADSRPESQPEDRSRFELVVKHQGLDAVAAVQQMQKRKERFAVALVDMRMPPGIDGLETAMRIRALDPDIYIIFVTAHSDHNVRELTEKVGGEVLFYKKPIELEELYQVVYNSVKGWNRNQELAQLRVNLQSRVDLQTRHLKEKIDDLEAAQQQAVRREQKINQLKGEFGLLNQSAKSIEESTGHHIDPNYRILAVDE